MSTLIREVKLIKAEAKVNSNKWWTGQLFDDGTVKATWGRVGYKGDSGQWNRGEKYFDKKIQEKLKKGYTYLKTIGNGNKEVSAGTSVKNKDLHSIARTQLVKSSSPKLERLIDQLVKSNIHRITQAFHRRFKSQGVIVRHLLTRQPGVLSGKLRHERPDWNLVGLFVTQGGDVAGKAFLVKLFHVHGALRNDGRYRRSSKSISQAFCSCSSPKL